MLSLLYKNGHSLCAYFTESRAGLDTITNMYMMYWWSDIEECTYDKKWYFGPGFYNQKGISRTKWDIQSARVIVRVRQNSSVQAFQSRMLSRTDAEFKYLAYKK